MAGNKALEKFKNSKIPKKGTAVVKDEVPIYQEPNTHSKIIGTIKKDEQVNWISKSICDEKEWVRCNAEKNFGYIIGNDMDGNCNLNMNSIQEKSDIKNDNSNNIINEVELTQEEKEFVNNALKEILADDDEKKDENDENSTHSKSTEIENISNHSDNFAKVEDELNKAFEYKNDDIFKDDEVVFEPKEDYYDNSYFDPDISNLDEVKKKFNFELNNFTETIERDKENEINYLNAINDIFPGQKNLPVKDLLLETLDSIPGGKKEKKNEKLDGFKISSKLAGGINAVIEQMEMTPGSFRITDGKKNGNNFSLKYYESGWNGGSKAQIKTYNFEKIGKKFSWVTKPIDGIFNFKKNYDRVTEIKDAFKEDGNKIGVKTMIKTFEKVGEFTGEIICKSLFSPIGSFLLEDTFSCCGSKIGKWFGKLLFEKNNENDKDKSED